jgi:hypothetical protein
MFPAMVVPLAAPPAGQAWTCCNSTYMARRQRCGKYNKWKSGKKSLLKRIVSKGKSKAPKKARATKAPVAQLSVMSRGDGASGLRPLTDHGEDRVGRIITENNAGEDLRSIIDSIVPGGVPAPPDVPRKQSKKSSGGLTLKRVTVEILTLKERVLKL